MWHLGHFDDWYLRLSGLCMSFSFCEEHCKQRAGEWAAEGAKIVERPGVRTELEVRLMRVRPLMCQ